MKHSHIHVRQIPGIFYLCLQYNRLPKLNYYKVEPERLHILSLTLQTSLFTEENVLFRASCFESVRFYGTHSVSKIILHVMIRLRPVLQFSNFHGAKWTRIIVSLQVGHKASLIESTQ